MKTISNEDNDLQKKKELIINKIADSYIEITVHNPKFATNQYTQIKHLLIICVLFILYAFLLQLKFYLIDIFLLIIVGYQLYQIISLVNNGKYF